MIYILESRDNFHSIDIEGDLHNYFNGDGDIRALGEVKAVTRDPVERRRFGDMTYWVSAPVISRKALDFLETNSVNGFDVVEILCHEEKLYGLKVTNKTELFDFSGSDYSRFEDGRVGYISRYAFLEDAGNGDPEIFKIPRSKGSVYVNKAFVDLVRNSGLKGFRFSEVWPNDNYRPLSRCEEYSMEELMDRDRLQDLEDDFDTEVWLKLAEVVDSPSDLESFPLSVRVYYASRLMEWEVGNGGFAQAAMNIPEWFSLAADAYEKLGKAECASLIRKANKIARGDWLRILLSKASIEKAFSYFREGRFESLDKQLDDVGWWSDWDRVDYVRAHRKDFIKSFIA